MATFYVKQTATGADDGSTEADAKSMTWFNANCAGGNTYILIGVLTSIINPANSGSDGSPIIIMAHPTLGASRAPTGTSAGANINGRAYVHLIGFTIDATGSTGNAVLLQAGANNIRVERNILSAGDGSCVSLAGASASAFSELDILSNTMTGGLTGVRFLGAVDDLAHSGIRVVGNTITGQTNEGVRLTIEPDLLTSTIGGCRVSGNTIRNTGYQSISIRAVYAAAEDDTPPALWGDVWEIDGNDISGCGTAEVESGSIHALGISNFTINKNKVKNCYTKGALIQGQRRLTGEIAYNTVSGATPASLIDGNGIFADRFDNGIDIHSNIVSDCPGLDGVSNSGTGIAFWMCESCRAYNNLIVRCKSGLDVGGNAVKTVASASIFNNTIFDCPTGFQGDNDGTGMDADSLALFNNFFVNCDVAIDSRGQELDDCDFNAFEGCGDNHENQTPGTHDLVGVMVVGADLRPAFRSRLRRAGRPAGITVDLNGRARDTRPSIGCMEPERVGNFVQARLELLRQRQLEELQRQLEEDPEHLDS